MNDSPFNRQSATRFAGVADRAINLKWVGQAGRYAMSCLFLLALVFLAERPAFAQCSGPNLLTNPSFELPVVVAGTNNIVTVPGWINQSSLSTLANVYRPNGSETQTPPSAINGSQYVDLQGELGIMDQAFTLTSPAVIQFSGQFSNRVPTHPSYTGGQIGIQIFNATNDQVAAATGVLNASNGINWVTITGRSSLLPPGNYTFRFFARTDWANFDNMSVCVATNAAQSCPDRTVLKPQPAWSVTASGFLPGYPPAQAIDGSTQDDASLRSLWVTPSNNVIGQYITFDYGSPQNLVGFVYYPRTFSETQDITGYSIQVSNDGVTFIPVQSGSISRQEVFSGVPIGNPLEVDFVSAITARYMRFTIVNAVSTQFAGMAELLPIVCSAPTLNTISCANADLLNTGTNSTGNGLATEDRFDNNWEVTWTPKPSSYNTPTVSYSDIGNATFVPAIVTGNKIPGTWANSPYGNANWISYTETSRDVIPPAFTSNTYFFRYRFNITDAYLLPAFKLRLNFLRDNTTQNIYINGVGLAPQFGLPSSGFNLADQAQTSLQSNWQLGENELVVQLYSEPPLAGFLGQNIVSCPGLDFGDAPASYNISRTTNGPGHIIEMDPNNVVTLKLGSLIDQEADGVASVSATADDTSNFDDEDGVSSFPVIQGTNGKVFTNYTVNVVVNNVTGATANLCGWIDWNNNGTFDAGEGVCTTVANGATSAQLVWPSATLTGVTGSSTGTYARIRLTTDALTSSSMNGAASNGEVEDYFIPFCVIPAPTATLVTPATICTGDPVTINYTTNPTGQVVQWIRMPGGVTGVNNFTDFPEASGTTPVSYTYSAWISNAAGSCSSETVTTGVTVNPKPIITPSVCSQTICSGQTGAITFTSNIPGETIHWLRTPTTPPPSSGVGNISQSLINTGPTSLTFTYTIWAEYAGTVSCPTSNTITCIIVVTPGLTVAATANSATVCVGSPLSLSASAVPAGNYTYAWTGPNGYIGSGANPTVSATAAVTNSGTYTVVVTDVAGCSGTATVPVSVNECTIPCNLTVTASASQTAVCVGGSSTLFSTVTPAGSYTYSWSGSNGFTSSLQNPPLTNIQPNPEGGPVVFTVRVTDVTGCVAQASVVVDVQQPIVLISSNAPLCASNTLSFSATAGFSSYSWSGPNGFSSNQQNPSIPNATTAATGSYSVVVTNALGCTASASQSLTIATQPSLTVTAGPSLTICSGQSTTLAISGNNNSPVVWANSLGQSGTGTSINFAGIRNIGAQPLSVTYVIGATAGSCSDEELVVVTILPEPVLVVQPSQVIYCDIEEVKLIATVTPSTATINWSRTPTTPGTASGSDVGTVTIQESLPAANYIYTFTATGTNGCSTTPMIVPVTVQQ